MEILGVIVYVVEKGERILKEVVDVVFKVWINNINDIFYVFGFVVGFYFYLSMVKDF